MTALLFVAPGVRPALSPCTPSTLRTTRRARASRLPSSLPRVRAALSRPSAARATREAHSAAGPSAPAPTPGIARRNASGRTRTRRLRALLTAAIALAAAAARAAPLLASATAGTAAALAEAPGGFASGVTASLALVLASEIGDKTFFISALLSMKYGRLLVLLGTMLALGSMTVISVGIGQLFHAVPATLRLAIPLDDYAAILLLLYFGVQNIRESMRMSSDEAEELEGAKQAVATDAAGAKTPFRVVSETSSLVFFAEWGDKSMLATVALAAAKSPLGVIVGGITGHLIASIIAVVSGSILGRFISEKNARLISGVLFLVFAVLTFRGVY